MHKESMIRQILQVPVMLGGRHEPSPKLVIQQENENENEQASITIQGSDKSSAKQVNQPENGHVLIEGNVELSVEQVKEQDIGQVPRGIAEHEVPLAKQVKESENGVPLMIQGKDEPSREQLNQPADNGEVPAAMVEKPQNGQVETKVTERAVPPAALSESDFSFIGDNDPLVIEDINDMWNEETSTDFICDGQDATQSKTSGSKRKRYQRHTKYQIDELEAYYKECPNPNEKQRNELSSALGLEPCQVKFWFQNKRTQVKSQQERHENYQLKMENERLRAENLKCRRAMSNCVCPECGGPITIPDIASDEHQLRLENERLREEVKRITKILENHVERRSLDSVGGSSTSETSSETAEQEALLKANMLAEAKLRHFLLFCESNGALIAKLATASLEELIRKIVSGEPLWICNKDGVRQVVNEEEYIRAFPRAIPGPRIGWRSESSIESGIAMMAPTDVVDIFMDLGKWLSMYSSMVSQGAIFQQILAGTDGSYDGAMQLMLAEFQALSPIVPTRESIFVRHSKKLSDHTWAIVDVSLDNILATTTDDPTSRCLRRPSGCLIEEMPNGFSKVTWLEHLLVSDQFIHALAEPIIRSGVAYGAKRWISILGRQSERLANATGTVQWDSNEIANTRERRSLLRLSERMFMNFCGAITASKAYGWRHICGDGADTVKIMIWNNVDDPGMPTGVILGASLSLQLPVQPSVVFNFLGNERTRAEWDGLSVNETVKEIMHVSCGQDMKNCVSVLQVLGEQRERMLMVQENSTDATMSSLIYAHVDIKSMHTMLMEETPNVLPVLPCGFTILPTEIRLPAEGILGAPSPGSLLTMSFQILVSSVPNEDISAESVALVNNHVNTTAHKIINALMAWTG